MKTQHFKGALVDERSSRACVLFDPKNGRIVHTDGITTLGSNITISAVDLETRAIARAKALGRDVASLKALHVPVSDLNQRGPLKVNASGTGLVSVASATQKGQLRTKR
jgi:hypothetical protein